MTNSRGEITMPQLRQACTRILDAIENRHGSTLDVIELGGGPYWTIVPSAAQLLHPEPEQQASVGDSVDDAGELAALTGRGWDEPVVIWHDAAHLSGLLRFLAFLDEQELNNPA